MSGGWAVVERGGVRHVVPCGDLRRHEVAGVCWCGGVEVQGLVVHWSADGREAGEEVDVLALEAAGE